MQRLSTRYVFSLSSSGNTIILGHPSTTNLIQFCKPLSTSSIHIRQSELTVGMGGTRSRQTNNKKSNHVSTYNQCVRAEQELSGVLVVRGTIKYFKKAAIIQLEQQKCKIIYCIPIYYSEKPNGLKKIFFEESLRNSSWLHSHYQCQGLILLLVSLSQNQSLNKSFQIQSVHENFTAEKEVVQCPLRSNSDHLFKL